MGGAHGRHLSSQLRYEVLKGNRLLFADLRRLERDVLPDGVRSREEAEILISLDQLERVDAGWPPYLVGVLSEFALSQSQSCSAFESGTRSMALGIAFAGAAQDRGGGSAGNPARKISDGPAFCPNGRAGPRIGGRLTNAKRQKESAWCVGGAKRSLGSSEKPAAGPRAADLSVKRAALPSIGSNPPPTCNFHWSDPRCHRWMPLFGAFSSFRGRAAEPVPSPLRGGLGWGCRRPASMIVTLAPPPPTPPRKGEESSARKFTFRGRAAAPRNHDRHGFHRARRRRCQIPQRRWVPGSRLRRAAG